MPQTCESMSKEQPIWFKWTQTHTKINEAFQQ